MTISTETRRAGPFTGTGAVDTYAFAFKIFATSDVVATRTDLSGVETTLVLNTDYTVSMNADQDNDPGGDVVLTANLTSGYLLTITSDVPELQSVELTNLGGFYPTVLNPLFDKLVILCQQISEKLGRQITLPVSSSYTNIEIPNPQANYYLQWKEDLTGLKNVAAVSPGALSVSPYIETLLNDADAATARTTLGGVSTLTGIETLTNKTLTTPTLTSPVLNGTLSGTAIGRGALVYASANQSIPNATQTALLFDTEAYDTDGIHSTSTNTGRLVVPAGWTKVSLVAIVNFSGNATGIRTAQITKNTETGTNGVPGCPKAGISILGAGGHTCQLVTAELEVTAGDYFAVNVYQSSGGALDVYSSNAAAYTWFSMKLIS